MADDNPYDEIVSKLPGGRLTKQELQRARLGIKLDERRYELRATFFRWVKIVGGIATLAGFAVQAAKSLNIHF